jgi:hypothetical protein
MKASPVSLTTLQQHQQQLYDSEGDADEEEHTLPYKQAANSISRWTCIYEA